MDTMAISKFKATCLSALERVRRTGRPLRITKFGKPIADIQPPKVEAQAGWLGSMRETATIEGDLVSSPKVIWEALE
jgi:antitoxin (DNA-binding transcriptional repressor) of toxin-antitoxin stability system